MEQININEVKTHFSATLAKVTKGETIIICKRNKPIAKIIPIEQNPLQERPVGLASAKYPDLKLPNDLDDPLPDDLLAFFTGEEDSSRKLLNVD